MKFKEAKYIPIEKLYVSKDNIRKGYQKKVSTRKLKSGKIVSCSGSDIVENPKWIKIAPREWEEFKTSVSKGVIDAMHVIEDLKGNYEIYRGQRRYLATKELLDEGRITNSNVLCFVYEKEDDYDPIETQTTEELMKRCPENMDVGMAINKCLEKHGTLENMGKNVGIPKDYLECYIQQMSLNSVETVEDANKEFRSESKKSDNLDDFTEDEKNLKMSLEQIYIWREWKKEFPTENETILKSKFFDYWDNSRVIVPNARIYEDSFEELKTEAVRQGITLRRLEEKILEGYGRQLKCKSVE